MNVGYWHKPGSAEWSAIRSLPGDNRTFSNPGSTLQQCNTPATQPIRSALQQLDDTGFGQPMTRAGRPFGRLHPTPGDFGCFLIQKL